MSVLNKISQEEKNNLIKVTEQKITFSKRKYRKNNNIILPPVESAYGLAEYILYEFSRIVSIKSFLSKDIDLYSIRIILQDDSCRFSETFGNVDRTNTGGLCVFKELKKVLTTRYLYIDDEYTSPIENTVYVNFSVRFPLNIDLELYRDDHNHSWEDGDFNYNNFYGYGPSAGNLYDSDSEEEEPINSIETFHEPICIICTEQEPNILFCHCGHIPLCEKCNINYKDKKCPVCKTKNNIKRKI